MKKINLKNNAGSVIEFCFNNFDHLTFIGQNSVVVSDSLAEIISEDFNENIESIEEVDSKNPTGFLSQIHRLKKRP